MVKKMVMPATISRRALVWWAESPKNLSNILNFDPRRWDRITTQAKRPEGFPPAFAACGVLFFVPELGRSSGLLYRPIGLFLLDWVDTPVRDTSHEIIGLLRCNKSK